MGSIAGYWLRKGSEAARSDLTNKMLRAASYRGPDFGQFTCGDCAEIGVGYAGDHERSRVEAFDGSVGVRLVLDGAIFACVDSEEGSASAEDVERVLKLYLRYKEDFFSKIDGSYSLVLYDSRSRKLILARDRLGTKPLFFHAGDNSVVFASEIKMLLESAMVARRVNPNAVDCLLSYGYVPCPLTMFEGIQQVKPGHMVIVENGEATEKRYWRFQYSSARTREPIDDLVGEFLDIFQKSVKRRLDRFPEAGAFLSGGLDTSSVVAVMRRIKGVPFKVFTAGFEEKEFNEIEDARIVADHLNLDIVTTVIRYEKDFADLLEKMVWHHDAPFADTSAIPSYYAARLAKEHVDTVLTGDFPDQLIGGSGHQVFALGREANDPLWQKLLRSGPLKRVITALPLSAGSASLFDRVKRALYREMFALDEQHNIMAMPVPPLLKRAIYSPDLQQVHRRSDPLEVARTLYREVKDECLLNRLLYFDILSYALDDLMVKVERACAAHGLEAFSPFHDREVVEFVATLPPEMKIRRGERKYVMRRAFEHMLPAHTMNKKKQGFAMPIGEWLVRSLPDYVRSILLDSKTLNRGFFDKKAIGRLVENFLAEKTDYASGSEATIICMLTLELWHRLFIDP